MLAHLQAVLDKAEVIPVPQETLHLAVLTCCSQFQFHPFDQVETEEADQHMGADAPPAVVEDGAKLEVTLDVAKRPFRKLQTAIMPVHRLRRVLRLSE